MSDGPRNVPASIHARLTSVARSRGEPFAEVLQYYGIERFLYRLSKTPDADHFILKGGLVFYGLDLPLRRPTRDIDFLSQLEFRKELVRRAIETAIAVAVPGDGIRFDAGTLVLRETQVDADRRGLRATFTGYLVNAEIPMQIDIGFSDQLTAEPETIRYPTILPDWDGPQLKSYPVEAIVAEKFHAMERFSATPSRWKDYYDLWLILSTFELGQQSLRNAIATTFATRETPLPSGRPASLTAEFGLNYQDAWSAFLSKHELQSPEINNLSRVVDLIWSFLGPALAASDAASSLSWKPGRKKWA